MANLIKNKSAKTWFVFPESKFCKLFKRNKFTATSNNFVVFKSFGTASKDIFPPSAENFILNAHQQSIFAARKWIVDARSKNKILQPDVSNPAKNLTKDKTTFAACSQLMESPTRSKQKSQTIPE